MDKNFVGVWNKGANQLVKVGTNKIVKKGTKEAAKIAAEGAASGLAKGLAKGVLNGIAKEFVIDASREAISKTNEYMDSTMDSRLPRKGADALKRIADAARMPKSLWNFGKRLYNEHKLNKYKNVQFASFKVNRLSIHEIGTLTEGKFYYHAPADYGFVDIDGKKCLARASRWWSKDIIDDVAFERNLEPNLNFPFGFHVEVYYNEGFNKTYPPSQKQRLYNDYMGNRVKTYLYTIMDKDDPMFSFIGDYLSDVEPYPGNQEINKFIDKYWEENDEIVDEWIENIDKDYPYKWEDPKEIMRLNTMLQAYIYQLTGSRNKVKNQQIAKEMIEDFYKEKLTLRDLYTLLYTSLHYNNVNIYNDLMNKYGNISTSINNTIFKNFKPNITDVSKEGPDNKLSFAEIVDICNKTKTLLAISEAERVNTANTFLQMFKETDKVINKLDNKVASLLKVVSNTVLKINDTNFITEEDKQVKEEDLKSSGDEDVYETYKPDLDKAFEEGYNKGRTETITKFQPILAKQRDTIDTQSNTINYLSTTNKNYYKKLLNMADDINKVYKESIKNQTKAEKSGYEKGFEASTNLQIDLLTKKQEERKRKAAKEEQERARREEKLKEKLGKKIKERAGLSYTPLHVFDSYKTLAEKAIKEMNKHDIYPQDLWNRGEVKEEDADRIINKIAEAYLNPKTPDVIDDLDSSVERKLDELKKMLQVPPKQDNSLMDEVRNLREDFKTMRQEIQNFKFPEPQIQLPPQSQDSETRQYLIDLNNRFNSLESALKRQPVSTNTVTTDYIPTIDPQMMLEIDNLKDDFKALSNKLFPPQQNALREYKTPYIQDTPYVPPASGPLAFPQTQEYKENFNFAPPSLNFSHSASNTSGDSVAPPPLKVYYPIKKRYVRRPQYN